ncbi:MAG TPA: LysR substrate-binding domain-containing protein, partial [Mycobacteriales bacterium]
MLDVGRLRALLAISEHGGVPAAARALSLSAADVHDQLTALEQSFGVTLVDGDRLTPAGQRVAASGSRALAALAEVEAAASTVGGSLRLGVEAAAGRALLPEALGALAGVSVVVTPLGDGLVSQDAAVVASYDASVPHRPDPAVERRELLSEPLLLAVPAGHALAARSSGTRLAELADEAWVVGTGDALVALERAAAAAGFEPVIAARVAEDALALTLVAAGHGIALLPASAVPGRPEGVRLLPLVDAGLRRTVAVLVRRSAADDAAVGRLVDALDLAARRVAAAVPGVTAAPGGARPVGASSNGTSGSNGVRHDPLSDPLGSVSNGAGSSDAPPPFAPRPAAEPSPFAARQPEPPRPGEAPSPFAARQPEPPRPADPPLAPRPGEPSRFAGGPVEPPSPSGLPSRSRDRAPGELPPPFAAEPPRGPEPPGLPSRDRGPGELPAPFAAPPAA